MNMAQRGTSSFLLDNRGSAGAATFSKNAAAFAPWGARAVRSTDGVQYLSRFRMSMRAHRHLGMELRRHMTPAPMFEAVMISKRASPAARRDCRSWQLHDSIYTERYLGSPRKNEKGYRDLRGEMCRAAQRENC